MNLYDFVADHLDIIKLISADEIFQYAGELSDLIYDLPFREFI